MSGNQESRIRLPTWRCSDFNAAIPLKKRKYLVHPQLPAMEEAGSAQNEQGDTSVARSGLAPSSPDENQQKVGGSRTNVGEPVPSLPSVSVGNGDKPGSFPGLNVDQIRVKVEEPNFAIHSSPLAAGFEAPSSANGLGSSLSCSLGKLPVGAEETGMEAEKSVLKTHDIVKETFGEDNLREKCQTEAAPVVGAVPMLVGCETKNNSPCGEKEESTSLNLSLSKGVCAPHNADSVPICTKSGNHSGVSRSNWDLNTTMDAWEDSLDRKTRVKTTGAFLNSNSSLPEIETSSCCDTAAIANSVPERQKEKSVGFKSPTVTLSQFDHQVIPTCSLSLGLSSYPPIEKSPSLSATTLDARAACTSISRPSGNVNLLNLRTVKSEAIEENARQETDSAQVCPMGLSISGVKQEAVGRFSQKSSSSSGILKPVGPVSVKTEPHNFTQSEVLTRKDGTLNHPHTPIMQSHEILDLPTSSTPNRKDQCIPYSNGIYNAPMSLMNQSVQSYPDGKLKENSGQNCSAADGKLSDVLKHGGVHMTSSVHGNLNASGVNVTSLTEERILNDRKTLISKDIPHNSRGTDEVSVSNEGKSILFGKGVEEELHRYGFESDCGHVLSRVIKKQVGNRNLNDDEKVQGPAANIAEGNEIANAECGGSETEQRDIDVPFHGDFQYSNHVEGKGSQPALLGNTGIKHIKECSAYSATNNIKKYHVDESHLKLVEMASTEGQLQRLTPEFQSGIFDGSAENEGRMVQDSEHSTHQIIHASEGNSGVSTVSGGNVENTEIVDNNSPVSYKAENSTIDNDPTTAEFSEGSQNRIINLAQVSNKSPIKTLDASGGFAPLRIERDRLPDFSLEPRKYLPRGSDESCKFSRERYHGKIIRSPRLNFMPDRRRFSDQNEANLHDRDTKSFEFDNHGNTRRGGRGGAFHSNFRRGRRPPNDEATSFSHSFPRRPPTFSSFTHRETRNKEDTSAFPGFRDGENASRGSQCNNTEPMFTSPQRPYRGRSGYFARGQTKYLNNKRDFPGYCSRSPSRSRERSPGPSSSFRNRSQEEFSGNTDFSHRRSPSGYRMEKMTSPDHSGYQRENVARRHSSPPYSHRPSNTGRGRGYARGRGYVRGRGYGRAGFPRAIHRNHGNLNNLDPRDRVNYNDDFFDGPNHSERFGVDVNVERRRFGYRHDGSSSFRPSFDNDGCSPTIVENDPDAVRLGHDPDAVRLGHDPDNETEERGSLREIGGKNKNSFEKASETTNMEEEQTSKHSENWQRDELGGEGF